MPVDRYSCLPDARGISAMRALRTSLAIVFLSSVAAHSETPEDWVMLGTRVHGGFGTFIPLGIRIGEDALQRLGVQRREVTVVYSNGNAPCPCVVDGIAIATESSAGQGTLHVTSEPSPPGTMGVVVVTDKKSGRGLRYTIPATMLPTMLGWNKNPDPLERFKVVMEAPPEYNVVSTE
jgi:formylmethanofuran dehydrogenase subunit E